jgi:tetratricopeptide (TPR) repeat protein/ribonuclease BN (tRNA processing enzyme)
MKDYTGIYDKAFRKLDLGDKAGFEAELLDAASAAEADGEPLWGEFFRARVQREHEPELALKAYEHILAECGSLDSDEYDLLVAMTMLGLANTLDEPKAEVAVCDKLIARFGKAEEPALREQVAGALVNKGVALDQLDRPQDELAAYDEVITRFGKAEEPALREQVATALFNKGVALRQLERGEEAVKAYDEVITRFGEAEEPALREQVAMALVNKGFALRRLERGEEAVEAYDEVIARFGEAEEPALRERVALALFNKGVALDQLDKAQEELAAYDEVIARFGKAEEPALRERVAGALVNKGVALRRLEQGEEAVEAYDEVIARFGEAEEPALRKRVAMALVNKGVALGQLDRAEEAVEAYDEVTTRFGKAEEPALREQVARALLGKGLLQQPGDPEQARQLFEQAREHTPESAYVQQRARLNIESLSKPDKAQIQEVLADMIKQFADEKDDFFTQMADQEKRTAKFLGSTSGFGSGGDGRAVLLTLREWNSYTPAVPDQHEIDRGGGYFIRYRGQGIVVDPGYDFIRNFHDAGGRIHDIDHIFITHAHNDHTQDFESLMSLLHEYNNRHPDPGKRVHIYLSLGAQRKFSGHLALRDVGYLGKVVALNQGCKEGPQQIALHDLPGASVTVLRAYHDDVITQDYSVGLSFEFVFGDQTKRVVFTGDTSLFPAKRDSEEKWVADTDGSLLYDEYPGSLLPGDTPIDVLVPHIGSIKTDEFKDDLAASASSSGTGDSEKSQALYFYPNHLGLRGLTLLLDKLRPKVAILSEFGEELKAIRFKLAEGLGKLLKTRKTKGEKPVFVIPGDLSIMYDIGAGKFLCHETRKFRVPKRLTFRAVTEPADSPFHSPPSKDNSLLKRTYLFKSTFDGDEEKAGATVGGFYHHIKANPDDSARTLTQMFGQ